MLSQAELSPLVLQLATACARAENELRPIPFMTMQEGIGRRTQVAAAESALSGRIVVEDVEVTEDDDEGSVTRRVRLKHFLVFCDEHSPRSLISCTKPSRRITVAAGSESGAVDAQHTPAYIHATPFRPSCSIRWASFHP